MRQKRLGAVECLDLKSCGPQHQCDGMQVRDVVVDDVDDGFASPPDGRYIWET